MGSVQLRVEKNCRHTNINININITNWISPYNMNCKFYLTVHVWSVWTESETETEMNPRVQKLWHLISINTSQCESRCGMQSSSVSVQFSVFSCSHLCRRRASKCHRICNCCLLGCNTCSTLPVASCKLPADATCNMSRVAAFILL